MLPIKAWRIYYADESAFDSTMGTWAEAPPFGVQCVVYYHVQGKTLDGGELDGHVYYYLADGYPDNAKMGLWMDEEGYYRIHDLALRSVSP